jgi:hypothetical protein
MPVLRPFQETLNVPYNKEARLAVKTVSSADPHKHKLWIFRIKFLRVQMGLEILGLIIV